MQLGPIKLQCLVFSVYFSYYYSFSMIGQCAEVEMHAVHQHTNVCLIIQQKFILSLPGLQFYLQLETIHAL